MVNITLLHLSIVCTTCDILLKQCKVQQIINSNYTSLTLTVWKCEGSEVTKTEIKPDKPVTKPDKPKVCYRFVRLCYRFVRLCYRFVRLCYRFVRFLSVRICQPITSQTSLTSPDCPPGLLLSFLRKDQEKICFR